MILTLRVPSDANHLVRDVALAEELSIRFGDERWAPGPVRASGRQEQCLVPLFQHIAGLHGVTLVDLEAARQRIADRGPNLLVNGPVAITMIFLATYMLRRIGSRFSIADEPVAVITATALCAVLMGGATIGAGRLGEALVETARLGNGHLSYRGLPVAMGSALVRLRDRGGRGVPGRLYRLFRSYGPRHLEITRGLTWLPADAAASLSRRLLARLKPDGRRQD